MNRRLILMIGLLAVSCATASAQLYPNSYEVTCSQGSVPISGPSGSTYDTSTGKYRAIECVDPFGNVALSGVTIATRYQSADAFRYVSSTGNDSNDGLSPGTAYATPQKCNTVILGLGGGTCDARTLYNYVTTTEIDVGAHSAGAGTPVTLLLPPFGNWACMVTGGTNNCLKVFDRSTVISTTSGQGGLFIISACGTAATGGCNGSTLANVTDVCGTEPSPGVGGSYLHVEGLNCYALSGATVSGFAMHIQSLFDLSRIVNVGALTNISSGKALGITNICCNALVDQAKGNGGGVGTPCTLGNSSSTNAGANIGSLSCTNAGTGLNDVAIVQFNAGSAQVHYHDIYTEANNASDTTTAVIGVTGSSGNADVLEKLSLGADQGGSTRCMIQNASGVSLVIRNVQLGGISSCFINDGNAGRGTFSPGASTVVTDYSTDPNVPVISYIAKPTIIPNTFANLGTPANGTLYFCSDCTVATAPCTGGSTGALAIRVNGAWRCQ